MKSSWKYRGGMKKKKYRNLPSVEATKRIRDERRLRNFLLHTHSTRHLLVSVEPLCLSFAFALNILLLSVYLQDNSFKLHWGWEKTHKMRLPLLLGAFEKCKKTSRRGEFSFEIQIQFRTLLDVYSDESGEPSYERCIKERWMKFKYRIAFCLLFMILIQWERSLKYIWEIFEL